MGRRIALYVSVFPQNSRKALRSRRMLRCSSSARIVGYLHQRMHSLLARALLLLQVLIYFPCGDDCPWFFLHVLAVTLFVATLWSTEEHIQKSTRDRRNAYKGFGHNASTPPYHQATNDLICVQPLKLVHTADFKTEPNRPEAAKVVNEHSNFYGTGQC